MTSSERWLAAVWPVVRERLPASPARVVEIGCGPLGGFVPMLRASGYEAMGIDPNAPDEEGYRRTEFEHADLTEEFDAVVACTSLHHVSDPTLVVDRIRSHLTAAGLIVVVEWAWEEFDEPTARWCFRRLASGADAGWLHRRRDEWATSGQEWGAYLRAWAEKEHLHTAEALLRLLEQSFDRQHLAHGPYFFPELPATSAEDERAAIDAGQIRAARIDYAGMVRQAQAAPA